MGLGDKVLTIGLASLVGIMSFSCIKNRYDVYKQRQMVHFPAQYGLEPIPRGYIPIAMRMDVEGSLNDYSTIHFMWKKMGERRPMSEAEVEKAGLEGKDPARYYEAIITWQLEELIKNLENEKLKIEARKRRA